MRLLQALILTGLFVFAGCSSKNSGIGTGNDTYRVTKVTGSVTNLSESADWSLPSQRRFFVNVCVQNNLRTAPVANQNFKIISSTKTWDVTSDIDGCLNWQEDWDMDYTLQPAGIAEVRRISAKNSLVAGDVEVRITYNPWFGLVSGKGKAVQSPDFEGSEGRVLTLSALKSESERPQLLTKSVQFSLAQLGQIANGSGEANVVFPLFLRMRNNAGELVEVPINRGRVHIELSIINNATKQQVAKKIIVDDLKFSGAAVSIEGQAIHFNENFNLSATHSLILRISTLDSSLKTGSFTGRFDFGSSGNIAAGSAQLVEELAENNEKSLGTEAANVANLAPLRLEDLAARFDGVKPGSDTGHKRIIFLAIKANFTDGAFFNDPNPRKLLVKRLNSDQWDEKEISLQTRSLNWIAEFEHNISETRDPISLPIEIRDPVTNTSYRRILNILPGRNYAVTAIDPSRIANYQGPVSGMGIANGPLPTIRLDKMCLSKPTHPTMMLQPDLKLNFNVNMTLGLTGRVHHYSDFRSGAHDEGIPAGNYNVNLVFVRWTPGSAPLIVSSIERTLVVEGGNSVSAQIDLPIHSPADLIAHSFVLAQMTDGKFASDPQLFKLHRMGQGCGTSVEPDKDENLKKILSSFPTGITMPELHRTYLARQQQRKKSEQSLASPREVAKRLNANYFNLEKEQPYYLKSNRNAKDQVEALECFAQASWDYEDRKAVCQFDSDILGKMRRLCNGLVKRESYPEVPQHANAFIREAAIRKREIAINEARILMTQCSENPQRYFQVEKKFVITEVDTQKPVIDEGGGNYGISVFPKGRASAWNWGGTEVEMERLFIRFFKIKGGIAVTPIINKFLSKKVTDETLAQMGENVSTRMSVTSLEVGLPESTVQTLQMGANLNAGIQVKGGVYNDAFDYLYDFDYNLIGFTYLTDMELDVTVHNIGVPAKKWQECYLISGGIPKEDKKSLLVRPDIADDFHPYDLACLPENTAPQGAPKIFPERYYYVVNSEVPSTTMDANDARNRYLLVFRGERDYSVWYRSILDSSRPYAANGVSLDVTQILRRSSRVFEDHSVGSDYAIDEIPNFTRETYVKENPNPGLLERFSRWWYRELKIDPFDWQGTEKFPDTNSYDQHRGADTRPHRR